MAANVEPAESWTSHLRRRANRVVEDLGLGQMPGAFGDDPPAAAAPPPAEQPVAPEDPDAMCRICFSGPDPELGRLFSPCLCRGTQRHVHVACLDRWRKMSQGQNSFFQCDQCLYRYRIGRTKVAGLATNPAALISATVLIFFVLSFIVGSLTSTILVATDNLPSAPSFMDYVVGWNSPLLYGDVIGGSVDEGLRVFGQLGERAAGFSGAQGRSSRPIGWHDEDEDDEGAFSRAYNYATGRSSSSQRAREKLRRTAGGEGQSWSASIIIRTALGFATLGVLSFLQLLASLAFLGPLHYLRLFRRDRGNDRRAGQRGNDLAAIVVVVFVLIGAYRAMRTLYRIVQRGAKLALSRLELRVLEAR